MLLACIVYHMGSGGNFLQRILTLSKNTIPLVPNRRTDIDQPNYKLDPADRATMYNCFNPADWRTGEFSLIMQYIWNQRDFYEYENSDLGLIATWHPRVFLQEDNDEVLWKKGSWPTIIFIDCTSQDIEFLNGQGKNKGYPDNSPPMISAMDHLMSVYNDKSFHIPFIDFLTFEKFKKHIQQIDKQLELELDWALVEMLWQSWMTQSNLCWGGQIELAPKNIYGMPWPGK